MRMAFLDCFAGISGDMFLGALVDAGVPLAVLAEAAAALELDATLQTETVDRSGISSTKVHVLEHGRLAETTAESGTHTHAPETPHTHGEEQPHTHAPKDAHTHGHDSGHTHGHDSGHDSGHTHAQDEEQAGAHTHAPGKPHVHGRSLSSIRAMIEAAALPAPVKLRAIRTFELLGESEAKIHNVPIERIHFHEAGAVDAIVDIVACSAGIEHLHAGGTVKWFASPVNVGSGTVVCAHGTFPVPAPATADLLRNAPTYAAHVEKELATPTGAALLRSLDATFGAQPPMRVERIGYGAGTRNPQGFPNVLRLSLGESAAAASQPADQSAHVEDKSRHQGESVTVLETALDDSSPQVLAHVTERALALGALDAMLTPVIMKKGRPGTLVTLLCNGADAEALKDLLLRETSTLGVRMHREHRACLERSHWTVETAFGAVRLKIGTRNGEALNVAPEFEDCRAAAARCGVAVKVVMQAALAAYSRSAGV